MRRSRLKERVASPTLHATAIFSMAVFVAIIVMAYVLRVEIVAKGIGKIVPLSRVQIVQSEFPGQISDILVRNGDHVQKGDVVIRLDATEIQTDVNRLEAEVSRLNVESARIAVLMSVVGEVSGIRSTGLSEILGQFRQRVESNESSFVREQARLLQAEFEELSDALRRIDGRRQANVGSKDVVRAMITRIDEATKTQKERLDTTQSLLDRGTASRAAYLDVLDAYTNLLAERNIHIQELQQKDILDATFETEERSLLSAARSRMLLRQTEINARLFELEQVLVATNRRLANTQLTAPTTGTVDKLDVFTIGGIVDAGQELLHIVPNENRFEVEAIFSNSDIGFLELGQKANIKLDAFPAERFGSVRGAITNVSADAIETGENQFGFVVRVLPDEPFLSTPTVRYQLQAGMTSQVDVITGDRRIISYFFAPILRTIQESLGER